MLSYTLHYCDARSRDRHQGSETVVLRRHYCSVQLPKHGREHGRIHSTQDLRNRALGLVGGASSRGRGAHEARPRTIAFSASSLSNPATRSTVAAPPNASTRVRMVSFAMLMRRNLGSSFCGGEGGGTHVMP